MRMQLSARTKIRLGPADRLHLGPQGFAVVRLHPAVLLAAVQRRHLAPFRTTDHEPEIFYVYPTDAQLPFGWRWRYSGVGLVHQSNGQSEPLSRSWNRWYLMTGAELGNRWQVNARLEAHPRRLGRRQPGHPELHRPGRSQAGLERQRPELPGRDRARLAGQGQGVRPRRMAATLGEGWNGGKSNLRLHVQLFSGYGDSLIDYNYKRTVFSVGLSLLDF
jgi:phospholipase A1